MLIIGAVTGMVDKQCMRAKINPAAYAPLLDTIAKGESNGNYNAYFGNASNTSVLFTEMTVQEVLVWQDNFVRRGNPSSAVGKYQIIQPTLYGLVQQLQLDPRTKFDAKLQDQLAITLVERRGAQDYVEKKLSKQEFAANLAKEWAALPKMIGDNPERSFYAGDGLNAVQVSVDEVYKAIDTIKS